MSRFYFICLLTLFASINCIAKSDGDISTKPEYEIKNVELQNYVYEFIAHEKLCKYYNDSIAFAIYDNFHLPKEDPIITIAPDKKPLKGVSNGTGLIKNGKHFIFIDFYDESLVSSFFIKTNNMLTFTNYYVPAKGEILPDDDSASQWSYIWNGTNLIYKSDVSYNSDDCKPCNKK